MAVAVETLTSVFGPNTDPNGNLTVSIPSGTTASDRVVLFTYIVKVSASGPTPTATGFTQRGSTQVWNTGAGVWIYFAVLDSNGGDMSAVGSVTLSWTGTGTRGCTAVRVSGTDGWDSTAGIAAFQTLGSGDLALASITTTEANELALAAYWQGGGTATTPSGWTASTVPSDSNSDVVEYLWRKAMASTGATGTATTNTASAVTRWGVVIAYQEAPAAPVEINPAATVVTARTAVASISGTATVNPSATVVAARTAVAQISAPTVPGAPTVVRTSDAFGYSSTVALSWTAPASDGGSAITGYKIEVSSNDGASWSTHTADTGSSSTSANLTTGLTNGTRYLFRVSAINAVGTGATAVSEWGCTPLAASAAQTTPTGTTDTSADWALARIDQRDGPSGTSFRRAWTGAGVRLYVIDSGIRGTHDEFDGADVVAGFAFDASNPLTDAHGHGTWCASKAVGQTLGVATGATLVVVKAYDGLGDADYVAAWEWIRDNHPAGTPGVVSSSLLYDNTNPDGRATDVDPIVDDIIDTVGLAVVQCTANTFSPVDDDLTPRTGLIHVGGMEDGDAVWADTEFDPRVDVFAPANDVLTANITSDSATGTHDGTSFGTPIVAGVIAMWLEAHPDLTPFQIDDLVKASSSKDKLSGSTSGQPNRLIYSLADIPPMPEVTVNPSATVVAPRAAVANVTGQASLAPSATIVATRTAVAQITASASVAPAGAVVAAVSATASIAGSTAVDPTGAVVSAVAATANITGSATVTPTGTTVAARTAVAQLTASTAVDPTPAIVAARTAVAQITAGTLIAGTGTIVAAVAGTADVTGTATIQPTTAIVAARTATGDVTGAATVNPTATVVAVAAATANIVTSPEVDPIGAAVTVVAAVAQVTATADITPTGTIVTARTAVATITATATVTPTGTTVTTVTATAQITATRTVIPRPTVVAAIAGTGGITGEATINAVGAVVAVYTAVATAMLLGPTITGRLTTRDLTTARATRDLTTGRTTREIT